MQAPPDQPDTPSAARKRIDPARLSLVTSISLGVVLALISDLEAAENSSYNPHLFAMGASSLFALACAVIAFFLYRNRRLKCALRKLEERVEELADRNWELKEASERANALIEAQGDVIVRRDGAGRMTYANDAYCALAQAPREELIGKPHVLPVLEQGDAAVLPDGTRVHDQRIAGPEGARWLAWREVTIRNESGGASEVQCVGRDVTDRTESERALAEARDAAESANRAKSRFLATVSHEIRTPLNGILGMTHLLLDTSLTPEQTTYVQAAKTSGETLLALIEEILDFSKIEAGKLDLEARSFLLPTLLEEVVELLAPRAQAKGLEIGSYVDERLPPRVVGDAVRLRQVLLNLAGNAIKFTERGGVSVVAEPGIWPNEIAFAVSDTGIGISPGARERIFREFEQGEDAAGRQSGGTGLGLAICQRIVERMGGRIDVDSVLGHGATFTFAVPLPAAAADGETFEAPDLAGRSIMIVAPTVIEASLIARRLVRWGAQVCVVPDETVAAAVMPERKIDALLIDHALGRAALDAVLQSAGHSVACRIVLLTPAERHALPALKEAGFSGYLVKPVRAVSLAARLRPDDSFEPAPPIVPDDDESVPAPPKISGLSILVAEDNEINALLCRSLLAKLGHRPTLAASGAEALDAWQSARAAGTPYDLALMDVHMPGLDGIEATRRIRAAERQAGLRPMPVIALTANASSEDREACLAAGMDAFLTKPLDREKLMAALAAAVPATLAA